MSITKKELRQQLRALRSAIPLEEQLAAADALCQIACALPAFQSAQQVALYWPNDNEISCFPLLSYSLQQRKHCYLPVLWLKNRQTLGFAAYDNQTPMLKNRYGILEPDLDYALLTDPINLDIIFVPLVGFDRNGWRLGRGGGFYDAAFADLHRTPSKRLPKLIGLAYECQCVDTIPLDSWDWKLDAIVTEKKVYEFQNSPAA
jgi:5-formyltetrahydrofolate cyclo-ligase